MAKTAEAEATIALQILATEDRLAELRERQAQELTQLEDALAHGWEMAPHRQALDKVAEQILEEEQRLRGLERRRVLEKRDELSALAVEADEKATAAAAEYARLRVKFEETVATLNGLDLALRRAEIDRYSRWKAAQNRSLELRAWCATNAIAILHAEQLRSGNGVQS